MSKLENIIYSLNSYKRVELDKDSPASRIDRNNPFYTEQGLNSMLKSWYDSLFHNEPKLNLLKEKVDKFSTKSKNYIKDIKVRLNKASTESKAAHIADKSVSSYVHAVYYTPDQISYDKDSTTAYVDGSKIIGVKESDVFITDEQLSSSKLSIQNTDAYIIDGSRKVKAIFVNHDGSPIDEFGVLNRISKTKLQCAMESPGKRYLTIDIDRKEYGMFNNIQLKTSEAHVYNVYASSDNASYEALIERELTNSLNISIPNSNSRYIRINVFFDKHTEQKNSSFIYSMNIEKFFVAVKKYSSSTEYISGEIPINAVGEFIGIDTCDNYQNKEVDMHYSISINGGRFRDIRPLRKLTKDTRSTRALLPINDYLDNRIVKLSTYEQSGQRNIFSSEIDSILLETNIFKYYDTTNPIVEEGSYIIATCIAMDETEIDFPDTYFVNGVPYIGKAKISAGINTVSFPSHNYTKLYDTNTYTMISCIDGNIKISDGENEKTIYDPEWKNNPFYHIIKSFKYILGRDITNDVELHSEESTYKISTDHNVKSVFVSARRKIANIDTVRLKIYMKSKDGYTIPYVSRVLIKVA